MENTDDAILLVCRVKSYRSRRGAGNMNARMKELYRRQRACTATVTNIWVPPTTHVNSKQKRDIVKDISD